MATGQRALEMAGPLEQRGERGALGRFVHSITHFARTKPLGTIGAVIVLVIILLAIFAPQIAPYGFDQRKLVEKLQSPNSKHLLGTDIQGRDVLSRLIFGARVSAFVGFGSVLIATAISGLLGMISGFFGGVVDLIVQRVVDVLIAIPVLILLLAVVAVFGTPTSRLHLGIMTLDPSQQR